MEQIIRLAFRCSWEVCVSSSHPESTANVVLADCESNSLFLDQGLYEHNHNTAVMFENAYSVITIFVMGVEGKRKSRIWSFGIDVDVPPARYPLGFFSCAKPADLAWKTAWNKIYTLNVLPFCSHLQKHNEQFRNSHNALLRLSTL